MLAARGQEKGANSPADQVAVANAHGSLFTILGHIAHDVDFAWHSISRGIRERRKRV
jgi:hypothetical protein